MLLQAANCCCASCCHANSLTSAVTCHFSYINSSSYYSKSIKPHGLFRFRINSEEIDSLSALDCISLRSISPPPGRYHLKTKQKQWERGQTFMPWAVFEPVIPLCMPLYRARFKPRVYRDLRIWILTVKWNRFPTSMILYSHHCEWAELLKH